MKYRLLRQSGLDVFDRKAIANLLGVAYASTNPILNRLVRAGILTRIRRDRYVLTEVMAGQTRKIANELTKPSAISLWTALSDSGITTHVPRAIQSVTPKRSAMIETDELPPFQYVHMPEALFFAAAPDRTGVFRVPPEKALLDILFVQEGDVDWSSIDVAGLNRSVVRAWASRYPAFVQKAVRSSPLRP